MVCWSVGGPMTPSDEHHDIAIVPPEVLRKKLLAGEVDVVDVRAPSEFNGELGHIEGARSVPSPRVATASAEWDRARPLVLVCRNGTRSPRLAEELRARGFAVAVLGGGMLAWDDANLPVSRH